MSILDRIMSVFVPHNCCSCGREGGLLCRSCLHTMREAEDRCHRCNHASAGGFTCADCQSQSPLISACAIFAYEGSAKKLVRALKFSGAQAAAQVMAHHMSKSPAFLLKNSKTVIVPVPTASSRVRGRGYDQAKLLARELAWITKTPYLDCLGRFGQTQQVGASRSERLEQTRTIFHLKHSLQNTEVSVLLIDDVLTTGATLSSAAEVLQASGVDRITALTFAKAPL